jgi:hypothetical protein
MYSKEGFLEAFKCLSSGVNVAEANIYLIGLEDSN